MAKNNASTLPTWCALQLIEQDLLALHSLLEWVADVMTHILGIGADEMAGPLVKTDAATFDLESQDPQVWMGKHEVCLPVTGPSPAVLPDPLNAVKHDPLIAKF